MTDEGYASKAENLFNEMFEKKTVPLALKKLFFSPQISVENVGIGGIVTQVKPSMLPGRYSEEALPLMEYYDYSVPGKKILELFHHGRESMGFMLGSPVMQIVAEFDDDFKLEWKGRIDDIGAPLYDIGVNEDFSPSPENIVPLLLFAAFKQHIEYNMQVYDPIAPLPIIKKILANLTRSKLEDISEELVDEFAYLNTLEEYQVIEKISKKELIRGDGLKIKKGSKILANAGSVRMSLTSFEPVLEPVKVNKIEPESRKVIYKCKDGELRSSYFYEVEPIE